jgi:hypothetical protein
MGVCGIFNFFCFLFFIFCAATIIMCHVMYFQCLRYTFRAHCKYSVNGILCFSPMDAVTCTGPVGMNDVPILYAVAQPDTIHFFTHTPINLSSNDAS